jgi:hypothetical protein
MRISLCVLATLGVVGSGCRHANVETGPTPSALGVARPVATVGTRAALAERPEPARVASRVAPAEKPESRFGLETDILWPFFPGATRTHVTAKLWQKGQLRGDVYAGVNVDFPQDRDTEGRFADYSVASGYRQYFWRGLHAEFSQTTGVGVLQDHVTTGKSYNSFDWLMTGYVGYKYHFPGRKLYIVPQFGIARVVYKSNPWPIFEDKTLTRQVGETAFPLGALRLGYSF